MSMYTCSFGKVVSASHHKRDASIGLRDTPTGRKSVLDDSTTLHFNDEVLDLRQPYRYLLKNIHRYLAEGGGTLG